MNLFDMNSKKFQRNSGVELLRLICIFFIIISHCCSHGINEKIVLTTDNASWQLIFSSVISQFGNVGNYVFLIISGYYLSVSNIKYKKIVPLIVEMFFYSWLIVGIVFLLGFDQFDGIASFGIVVSALVPILFGYNWFVCCYIVLYLCCPFINRIINNLEKKDFKAIILIFYTLGYLLPVFRVETFLSIGHNLPTFIFAYLIGAYINKYRITIFEKHAGVYLALALIALVGIPSCLGGLGIIFKKAILLNNLKICSEVLSVPLALILVIFFKNIKFVSVHINFWASSVLGVYLIHDNKMIRALLWNKLFRNTEFINSALFPIMLFGEGLCVLIFCLFADKIREILFQLLANLRGERNAN